MPKSNVPLERVNITLPEGTSDKAKKLGINISFHAAKAVQAEIDRIEGVKP